MDNNVFVAESEVEFGAIQRTGFRHSRPDAQSSKTSRSASRKDVNYEDTPLLSRVDDEDEYVRGSREDEGPSWLGERGFEGQPWWKRPSVRFQNDELGVEQVANLHCHLGRSSGCYLLSSSPLSHSEESSFQRSTSSSA